jgi:cardiolipin synthase
MAAPRAHLLRSGSMDSERKRLGFRSARGEFVPGNAVTFLRDGREAFPAMLEAIESAKQQILLEMYWFESDRTGRRFAEALARARARGVEVAVIYDSVGSLGADREMFAELERRGVHVLEYHPVAPWRRRFRFSLARLSNRNHRKILVTDGSTGFTGGINLADEWLPLEEEGGGWRDDMVRIVGPAVDGFTRCFHRIWRRHRCPPIHRLWADPAAVRGGRLLPVRVVGERFFQHRHEIARDYTARLAMAKHRAYIANSYFVPDRPVRRALLRAARRGVDVRILVPANSDVEPVKYAGRAVYGKLLKAGVRIFEWQDTMYHSKTAVIDGEWSTIGTFNLDYMSLRFNLEVNACVLDREFASEIEASFARDLLRTREIEAREFRFRPLADRLLEYGFYRMRKIL